MAGGVSSNFEEAKRTEQMIGVRGERGAKGSKREQKGQRGSWETGEQAGSRETGGGMGAKGSEDRKGVGRAKGPWKI